MDKSVNMRPVVGRRKRDQKDLRRAQDDQKGRLANQDLRPLRPAVRMAQEMGKGLGRSQILLGPLPFGRGGETGLTVLKSLKSPGGLPLCRRSQAAALDREVIDNRKEPR